MSEFERRPDQAENLRTKMIDDYKKLHGDYPSRGEVHKDKVKKTKLRMKYPVISLLALLFILLPILFLSITFYYGSGATHSVNGNDSSENELVYIANSQQSDEELDTGSAEEESEPSVNEEASTEETTKVNETEYREVKTHTVAADETLFKIAIKYYNNRSGEDIIRQYNGIEANEIYEGQVLKIPLK